MKDSNVDWLGQIPAHWDLKRAKFVFKQSSSKGNRSLVLLSATQDRGVVDKSTLEGVVQVAESADLNTFKTVHINDFVISLRSFQGGFEISHCEGVISPAYTVFRLREGDYVGYYKHLFKSIGFIDKINSLTVGIREGKNIQYEDFSNMLIPFLSVSEQQAIADFLDKKCDEIDEMVSLQEKIVEELKTYKQSVITEAVCKGLNPNVPMKESGIEWEGKVPQTWQKVFLKWYFFFEKGKNAALYTADYIGQHEGSYVVYSGQTENEGVMGRIDTFDYDIEECLFTTTVGGKVMTPRLLHGKFSLSQNCLIMKKKGEISNHFIYYLLMALFAYEKSLIPSYMQPSLRIEDLKTYTFFLPQYNEQKTIADFLDTKCTEIDALISLKLSKIDALKEYKKSIIYEYITGKKEING